MSDLHGGGHSDTRLGWWRGRRRSSGPSRWPPSGEGAVSHLERAKHSRHGSYADRYRGRLPVTWNMIQACEHIPDDTGTVRISFG